MRDEAAELFTLESEAAQAEAQLEQDLARARQAAELAAQRLAQLKALAQQVPPDDEEARTLGRQLSQLAPPRLEDAQTREAALKVRRQALAQRRAAGDTLRAALEAYSRGTGELELTLTHQEAWLARAQQRLRSKPAPAARSEAIEPQSRRETPRVAMYAQVDLGSESNFYAGFSTNLSEGGLFIATVSTPPRGTQVELTFSLPGGSPIKCRGVVRWTREVDDANPDTMPGAGVEFVELSPEIAASISAFVLQRDPLFYVD